MGDGYSEERIREQLTEKEYKALITDLTCAVRAFHVLGTVAPELLNNLIRRNDSRPAQDRAQQALEELIADLRSTPDNPPAPRMIKATIGPRRALRAVKR